MPRCPGCGRGELETLTGLFAWPEDAPGGWVVVSGATWLECAACGEQVLSKQLEEQIGAEVQRRVCGNGEPREV